MRRFYLFVHVMIFLPGIADLKAEDPSRTPNLCVNGGFEDQLKGWEVLGNASLDREIKLSGGSSVRCECAKDGDKSGVSQRIVLDQKAAIPIVLSAWSKAQVTSGAKGNHYSLWCDVEYQNDTRPGRVDDWRILPFDPAKPDWQHIGTVFTPEYPIKHITFHLLFRLRYTGRVWFDDASVRPISNAPLSGEARDFSAIDPNSLPGAFTAKADTLKAEDAFVFLARPGARPQDAQKLKLLVNGKLASEGEPASAAFSLHPVLGEAQGELSPPYCSVRVCAMWDERRIIVERASGEEVPLGFYLLLPERARITMIGFEDWEVEDDSISAGSFKSRILLRILFGGKNDVDRFSVFFDEGPSQEVSAERHAPQTFALATDDGLKLELGEDGGLWGATIDGRGVISPKIKAAPFGLLLGDAVEGRFRQGNATVKYQDKKATIAAVYPEADLRCEYEYTVAKDHIAVEGTIFDLRESDRAVDLLFKLPIECEGLEWWKDLSAKQVIKDLPHQADGLTFGCVTSEKAGGGVALAVSPFAPCRYALGYDPKDSLLNVRIKYGLSPIAKLKQKATFALSIYRVDARWGLRDAAQRYYDIYPAAFARRAMKEGMWLFAFSPTKLPNPQDYAYYEGGPKGADVYKKLGILTFPYIIPGQRSIQGLAKLPADYAEAMQAVAEFQVPPNYSWGKDIKPIVENCRVVEPDGKFPIRIRDDVGADIKPAKPINMVVFPVNCDPDLFCDKDMPTVAKFEFAKVQKMLAEYPQIDGIYVDSGSGWVSRHLNARRDHFPYADYPLTYDEKTGKLAIDGRFTMVEFFRGLGGLLHPSNRLVFPNHGCGRNIPWHYFVCDVVGLEGRAVDIPSLRYFRTLSYQKPALRLDYMGLLGIETQLSTREGIEQYFKRCTLFGIYPSIGRRCEEAYQKFPDLYKTYMPILRRLGAAGWQPRTFASCSDEKILMERFGPKEGQLFFTVYNDSDAQLSPRIRLDVELLGISSIQNATELVTGKPLPASPELSLTISPGEVSVIALSVKRET